MKQDFEELLADFSGNDPATEDALRAVETKVGKTLPPDFRELLKISNGGEGNIGNHYLMIWSIEEVLDYNQQYEVEKYAPGLMIFGSSGGGEAYAFDYRSGKFGGVVKIPFVGMDLDDVRSLAPAFIEFLRGLRNG